MLAAPRGLKQSPSVVCALRLLQVQPAPAGGIQFAASLADKKERRDWTEDSKPDGLPQLGLVYPSRSETVSPLALAAGEMALRSGPSGRIRPNLLALMGCALLTSIGSAFYYFSSRLDRLAQVLVQGGSCAR